MSATLIREKKAKAQESLNAARRIRQRASDENREPNANEQQQINGHLDEVEARLSEARTMEREEGYAQQLGDAITTADPAADDNRGSEPEPGRGLPTAGGDDDPAMQNGWNDRDDSFDLDIRQEARAVQAAAQMEYRQAFNHYLRQRGLTNAHYAALHQVRTLVEGVDADGGYLAPTQLVAGIQREAQEYEEMKPRMLNINTNARSLTFTKGLDSIQMGWVPELGTKPEDQPTFGRTVLVPHVGAVVVWVSDELLEDETFGLESYIATLVGEAKVLLEEEAFVSGSGTGRPFGILTRLNALAGTPQRSTVSVAAGLTAEAFINVIYAQPRRYRRRATWIMGTELIRRLALLRENGATGNFLWQPGLQAGQPATVKGYPVIESDAVALNSGFTAGNDLAIFGDLRRYMVMNRIAMQVKRLEELRALTDEVGFRFRFRTGGDTVVNEAFRTVRAVA